MSKQPSSIKHVVLTESGEADCYSNFCMSGSLNESMAGISNPTPWQEHTRLPQSPQHMCWNEK